MGFEDSKIEQARTENEAILNDPELAKKKKKADRRRRRKYKFSDKKHSKAGIAATVMAVFAIALVVASIVLSVAEKGQGGAIVGALPFAALLLSTIGIVISSFSFRRTDTIFTFSWTGLISNIIVWLFVAFVLVSGI